MKQISKKITELVTKLRGHKLENNTQRVLLKMLTNPGEWVARSNFRVPSATSRIRDLRTEEFGQFEVNCTTGKQLKRNSKVTKNPTFYRLNPNSITIERVSNVFGKGVVKTA